MGPDPVYCSPTQKELKAMKKKSGKEQEQRRNDEDSLLLELPDGKLLLDNIESVRELVAEIEMRLKASKNELSVLERLRRSLVELIKKKVEIKAEIEEVLNALRGMQE